MYPRIALDRARKPRKRIRIAPAGARERYCITRERYCITRERYCITRKPRKRIQ